LLQGGIPPKVKILNIDKEYNNPTKEGMYRMDIEVCSQGNWSGDIKIYRNGKIVNNITQNSRAFREQKMVKNRDCPVIEKMVSLRNGDNLLGVKAITEEDVESNIDTKRVTYKSNKKIKPNLYMVTLSVNEYDDSRVNDLQYTSNDADAIVKNIKDVGKSVFKNIYSHSLKEKMVTKENIFKTFKEIGEKTTANDVFLLFISGHGEFDKILKEYFFIPATCRVDDDLEKKAIGQKVLFNALSYIQAGKSILLLDTCQSGGIINKELENSTLKEFGSRTGRAILSASTKSQYAREGYKNHGVFTYTILEALKDKENYYRGKIYIHDLARYVKEEMPKKTQKKWGQVQNAKFFNSNTDMDIVIGGYRFSE
jgi:hypothetical protein